MNNSARPNPAPERQPQARLVFDGTCRGCRVLVAWLLARRGAERVVPVTLDDSGADEMLAGLTPERRAGSWHLITPVGQIVSGGHVAAELGRHIPALRATGWLAAVAPAALDRGYEFAARHRGLFGRLLTSAVVGRADAALAARRVPPPSGGSSCGASAGPCSANLHGAV